MQATYVYSFEKLDAMRERKGLSWYRIALEVGAPTGLLIPTRLREHVPTAARLLAIADLLGCDIKDFFTQPDLSEQEKKPGKGKSSSTPKASKPKGTS